MENVAKAAAVGALAMNGGAPESAGVVGGGGGGGAAVTGAPTELKLEEPKVFPDCPARGLPEYHNEDKCAIRPQTFHDHASQRSMTYNGLKAGATGATLVPNQQTVYCPRQVQQLGVPNAVRGFDTTWIVENTATTPVELSWVMPDGKEYSPFHPDVSPPQDNPEAILQPDEWKAVPAFESYVYHVRALSKDNKPGEILLQHRAGLVPIGNPNSVACDPSIPDVEPVNPLTAQRKAEFARTPTPKVRRCNTMDVGFRNQAGCPLHVYWAGSVTPEDVPASGFTCGEKFKFHLGTKPATQDFMHDWESSTKFEGSFIGHTFIARLASDPSLVVDSYTLMPTKVVDCPDHTPQMVSIRPPLQDAEGTAKGNKMPSDAEEESAIQNAAAIAAAATAAVGHLHADQPLPDIGLTGEVSAGVGHVGGEL